MAGRPKGRVSKTRSDTGTKRGNYKTKHDSTGKTFKENAALKSFWSNHKVEDIIQLSTRDLDKLIYQWLEDFQQTQINRDRWWWYPEIHYDPTPKKKGPKKINSDWNTSFRKS